MAKREHAPEAKYNEKQQRFICKGVIEYHDKKLQIYGTSKKSAADAQKAFLKNAKEKKRKADNELDLEDKDARFSTAIDAWYDTFVKHKIRGGRARSARTIDTDMDTITQLKKAFGQRYVSDISSEDVQDYLNSLTGRLSQSTINKRFNMLNMFFRYVYADERNNPMKKCFRPYSARETDLINGEEKKAYTDDEMELLARELSKPYNFHSRHGSGERGYSCGNLVILIMYEALRISEAVELRVADICWNDDETGGMLWIRRQYDEKNHMTVYPKYATSRKVPIMPRCVDILKEASEGKKKDDLLFPSRQLYKSSQPEGKNGGHLYQNRLRDNFNRAQERVRAEHHTVHDLRHDRITSMVDSQITPESVQRWVGHKSLYMTLDGYYRPTGIENEDDLKKANPDM